MGQRLKGKENRAEVASFQLWAFLISRL